MVKVSIKRDECINCGTCEDVCSDVFELDEDDVSQIVEEYQDGSKGKGDVPDDLKDCARKAADSCPEQIIQVE